jgi:cell wall-associated NlpC family hydrolase
MDRRNAMFLLCLLALPGCGTTSRPGPPAEASRRHPAQQRNEVALIALSQVGLPYRWGGDSPAAGFDCSGLVVYVFHESLRIALPRTASEQARTGHGVGRSDLRPGDLVFFNTMRQRYSHVGIYVGNGRFVHAPTAKELVKLEQLDAAYWRERFNGARRLIA